MVEQNAKPGAIALDEMLNDIEVPSLDVPELGALLVSDKSKDLFEEKKRKAWKELDAAEARCDFAPNRMRITNRGGVFFITLWKKSVYGRTLTDIKGDDDMVGFFADNITPLIRSVLGSFLSPDDFAVVTTPKRRHKERNFATLIAIRIAEKLGLPFFEDCAFAPSKHRVGTVFTANNIPPQRNIIVFDDFVTTGQTLVSMQNLLVSLGKNCTFFAGINNPTVLGIKPIPNIQQKISDMIAKYRAETLDIEDVEFEEADLELDVLFPDIKAQQSSNTIESH